jgi:hypothetical protein
MSDSHANGYFLEHHDGPMPLNAFIESADDEAPVDWLMGAGQGAAAGAALGPYGALAGAAIGATAAAVPDISRAVQGNRQPARRAAPRRATRPAQQQQQQQQVQQRPVRQRPGLQGQLPAPTAPPPAPAPPPQIAPVTRIVSVRSGGGSGHSCSCVEGMAAQIQRLTELVEGLVAEIQASGAAFAGGAGTEQPALTPDGPVPAGPVESIEAYYDDRDLAAEVFGFSESESEAEMEAEAEWEAGSAESESGYDDDEFYPEGDNDVNPQVQMQAMPASAL